MSKKLKKLGFSGPFSRPGFNNFGSAFNTFLKRRRELKKSMLG